MNNYDVVCLLIFLVFITLGWHKGLIRSAFGIASTIIAMFLTYVFFPPAVRFLRMFGVYGGIKQYLEQIMDLQGAANGIMHELQTEFINSLPQSRFILGHIQANNNPEAYSALNVSGFSDYISGYLANMAVNLIAAACLFIIVRILLSLALNIADTLARLPVVDIINKAGGAAFGFASGLIFIWFALCIMTFFFLDKNNADLYNNISSGILTGFLYNNNPIMEILVKLAPF